MQREDWPSESKVSNWIGWKRIISIVIRNKIVKKKKKKNEAGECHDSKCYIEKKKDTQPTWKK